MCSTYLALGGASYVSELTIGWHHNLMGLLALIFVPPLTDFSKEPDMADEHVAMWSVSGALYKESLRS